MKPASINATVLVRVGRKVRRRTVNVVNGKLPREQWLRDCMQLAFGNEFTHGDLFLVVDRRIVMRWLGKPVRFVIPPEWECPTCGDHECPGCLPAPGQTLSCFV